MAGLLRTVLAEGYFAQLMRWLEASAEEPAEWQEAAAFGDRILWAAAGLAPSQLAVPGFPERFPATRSPASRCRSRR